MWDLSPAWGELRRLGKSFMRQSPLIQLAILLLVATCFATKVAVRGAGALLERRFRSQLLREIIFPQGVPIREVSKEQPGRAAPARRRTGGPAPEAETHRAEGALTSEAGEIQAQAEKARMPEEGENLLGS